ncbi:Crp/Fnr family transcriptional regulator [Comamonas sp. NLF-1-9]|uniref:Crp/Fnr family transcriptional regulator n=1 Tax=Comamonas sp. NLF-1-9 TaxID=2853163 RepID=UPI001C488B36|nr:Crp/Fnr family transcriptional regulator [Comamonas sp. NLF-1-9]QXL85427.1 Crp/Fnr family transcriptional regulator [Comamonas sp. NLF-1-9]
MKLIDAFQPQGAAPLPEVERLQSEVRPSAHARREAIFRLGDMPADLFFVREGLVKLEYATASGQARVRDFVEEGRVFAALESLQEPPAPVTYTAVALEPTVLERVPLAVLMQLGQQHPAWAYRLSLLLLETARNRAAHEQRLLTLPALERYAAVLAQRPWLETRVRQYELAAYIGLTPVSLSRLRSRACASS